MAQAKRKLRIKSGVIIAGLIRIFVRPKALHLIQKPAL